MLLVIHKYSAQALQSKSQLVSYEILSVTTNTQTQSSAWYPKCASNYQALTSYVVCPDFVYGLL